MRIYMKVQHFWLCTMHNRECIGHPFEVETGPGFREINGLRFYHPDKIFWNV